MEQLEQSLRDAFPSLAASIDDLIGHVEALRTLRAQMVALRDGANEDNVEDVVNALSVLFPSLAQSLQELLDARDQFDGDMRDLRQRALLDFAAQTDNPLLREFLLDQTRNLDVADQLNRLVRVLNDPLEDPTRIPSPMVFVPNPVPGGPDVAVLPDAGTGNVVFGPSPTRSLEDLLRDPAVIVDGVPSGRPEELPAPEAVIRTILAQPETAGGERELGRFQLGVLPPTPRDTDFFDDFLGQIVSQQVLPPPTTDVFLPLV